VADARARRVLPAERLAVEESGGASSEGETEDKATLRRAKCGESEGGGAIQSQSALVDDEARV